MHADDVITGVGAQYAGDLAGRKRKDGAFQVLGHLAAREISKVLGERIEEKAAFQIG